MKKVIRRIAERLMKKNKNFLAVFIGETGSGKSESAISLGYMIEKEVVALLKERGVPEEEIKIKPDEIYKRIVFTGKEFMDLTEAEKYIDEKGREKYRLKYLHKGNVVIWDEAGAGEADNQRWQTNVAIAVNHVVQTFRSDNIAVLFTVPYRDWVNKKIRQLFHATFETVDIIARRRRCLLKFFYLKKNHRSGDVLDVYPRVVVNGVKIKIGGIYMPRPPVKIRHRYIEMKERFNFLKKQEAKKAIEELEKPKIEEKRRLTREEINNIVKELEKNIRILGRFTRGKWTISKDTIEGLYNCHSKDATIIKALLELKVNR